MATTKYVSSSKNPMDITFLGGYDYTSEVQALDILPIYTNPTPITIPYTGTAIPVIEQLTVEITSGTNPRTLILNIDYTVLPPNAGNLVITILANALSENDEDVNGFTVAHIEFYYERYIIE